MHPLNPLRPWRAPLFVLALCLGQVGLAQTPAFPGALGFGRFSTGGRGGSVYHVTNTNDSGAGSFRTGVTTANRTVVFDVGGVIRITSPIVVANNVTIAGQTAPGGGVTVYGHRFSYSGANNSITRFIRVRMGINGDGNDAITIANGHDMIFDHLSVSWGEDETFSVSGSDPQNISIQSTIIAQGLQDHSAGGLIQTAGGISIVRSLYIDNNIRNPKVKFVNEFVNNVVYNWGDLAYILGGESSGQSYANAINNYFIKGPNSSSPSFSDGNLNFHLFASNNFEDGNLNGVLDGAVIPQVDYGVVDWQATPFNYPTTNALPPLTALKTAISDVGASWQRDIVDERLMTELTSWGVLGETISSEFETPMTGPGVVKNGTAYPDTDQDGLPDFWEAGLGMNTNLANNNVTNLATGYTQLEDYLNWLAEPHGIALTNTAVDIDLRQFTRGFTNNNPVYSVSGASNGVATFLNGHIVRFVPDANFIGQAGFQFSVVDGDGSTFARPMNLFFTPLAQSFNPLWRGDDATNNWDALGDHNWFNGQSLLYPFRNGDNVTFDDSGSTNPALNLIGSLQPSAVTFDATKNFTLGGSGSLDGAMTLTKTGSGTATLNTTNNFSGNTTVSNGALLVHGALNQSVIIVRSGAILGGNGRLGVAPVLQTGARLAPGHGIGGAGTLTVSNALTESGGINNYFDLSDDPTGTSKTNDQIIVVGALTVSGKNIIRVSLPNGPLLNGIYPLFKYTSFSGSLTNFTLINANGVLTNPPGQIAIFVNNIRTPGNLKWAGGVAGNAWDDGTTTNWLNAATPDVFHFFDTILFDDTGSTNPAINLVGSVTPASVTFNATKNFTLAGSGKISGYGTFTKTNSGTLTVQATNDYAGLTVIGGGVLSVPWLANSGLASPLGAADNNPDNIIFTGGTLRFSGTNTSTDHGMTFGASGGTIDVKSNTVTVTLGGVLAGSGTLTKAGPGILALAGINTFSGGTIVTEGAVQLNTTTGTGGFGTGPVTMNGTTNSATFRFSSDGQILANTLNVTGTNNFTVNSGNNTVSDMTGNGTLILSTGTTFSFAGDMTGFSGTILVGAVTNPRFNPSTGSSNAIFDLGNTSALLNNRNGGLTIQLGALTGGPNTELRGASSANSLTTYVIGGRNLDTLFAGKISEVNTARTNAITKVGTGTLTLTGANTHSGSNQINGGTLLANNTTGSATGVGILLVNDGGTLGGKGFISSPVIVNSGGAISPGSNGVATLTLRSNLTLSAGAVLNFEWAAGTTNDRLAITNNLILGGTLNISNVSGFAAGSYLLMTYGGALSGVLPVIGSKPAGFSCTVNTNTAGQVRLIVQAQTPPVFGSIKLVGTNVQFSGSGGPTNVAFYVLSATDLATPLTNWTRLATNSFNTTGGFIFTNPFSTGSPQQFYRLQLP